MNGGVCERQTDALSSVTGQADVDSAQSESKNMAEVVVVLLGETPLGASDPFYCPTCG